MVDIRTKAFWGERCPDIVALYSAKTTSKHVKFSITLLTSFRESETLKNLRDWRRRDLFGVAHDLHEGRRKLSEVGDPPTRLEEVIDYEFWPSELQSDE